MSKRVLVAGATGVVGQSVLHACSEADLDTLALSRRVPRSTYGSLHRSVDLLSNDALKQIVGDLAGVTHLVYAALHEEPGLVAGWQQASQIEANDRMLRNLLGVLRADGSLKHVTLLQGTKAYGAHLRPIDLPARENRSEHAHDNFYWRQEQALRSAASADGFSWTILRPQIIFGGATGVAMNLIPVLGAYGALLRNRNEPLHFPGGPSGVLEAVDADLLARVVLWAGSEPAARDEIFNVTNGDVFSWRGVWPVVAEALGMAAGQDRPQSVAAMLNAAGGEWRTLATSYGLREPDLQALLGESHFYADFTMAYGFGDSVPPPAIVSTIKLRQAGFSECMDTERMLMKWLRRLQAERLLPPP
ncbi:MAG: NAD-dependent epimerase/dehydratase family protein [Pseudomonadota bacterium]